MWISVGLGPAHRTAPSRLATTLPIAYLAEMELHGSLLENISAAIASARRLRGHRIYPDTLSYWDELLHQARRELVSQAGEERLALRKLILELESEIAERSK